MRTTFKHIALAGIASMALMANAQAQDWPAAGKAVQIVVPAPGGGGTGDTIARIVAEELSKSLKGNFIIDNKPGANGNIGAASAASAAPDGYRLLFSWAGTLAVNPNLYKKLSFDPIKDFEPIGLIADVPNILVVNDKLPTKSLNEFIQYAKASPGKINFGSTGTGSSMHLAGELFMRETGTSMIHVPYNAPGQATTNMIAGDIQAMFQLVPGIAGQVKAGRVRALALMADQRSPALPDVPSMKELGHPDLMSSTWFALLAPKGTPTAVLDKLNKTLNEVLTKPEVHQRLADLGASTLTGSRDDLRKHLAAETAKWGKIIREAKIEQQ
ncbi:Bug family tripartite tricarboxylate transporter substrate binding protein [Alicycliphilus denitrificans]|uniref:Bug family tripartite tricarboxylate transporter substrate binding protein n=1 Tax=Alicycliphilus denitrificans TaxID=179636 RepID=UPI00384E1AFF